MSDTSMPYKVALEPIQSVYDKKFRVKCPKCKVEKQVSQIVKMINAYGCYDGTVMLVLECGHTLMPWEREI